MQSLRHLGYWGIVLSTVLFVGCSAGSDGWPTPGALGPLTDAPPRGSLVPRLNTLTPGQGPNLGGSMLILSGEDFAVGATVMVGGAVATQVTVWSGTRITARLPASPGVFGKASVVVQNPDGQEIRRDDLFHYYASPLPFQGPVFGPTGIIAVAAGDFDGDGKSDLVATNASGVYLMLNNAQGGFGGATGFSVGTTPTAIVVGDWNGDGRQDLAVANSGSNNVSVLLGTGVGWFGAANHLAAGTRPVAVMAGDWNGDGKPDLAIANNGSNDVSVLLGIGSGSGAFAAARNFPAGIGPQALTSGDWNGDGKPDLAVANNGSNTISLLLGNGAGSFAPPVTLPAGSQPTALLVGDWNGDGKQDLAIANHGSNSVSLQLGNGTGAFLTPVSFAATAPLALWTRDWNGDRKLDLAILNSSGFIVRFGDGQGGFTTTASFPTLMAPEAAAPAISDFNGDLLPDLAIATAAGVVLLLGDSQGGGGSPERVSTTGAQGVAMGDFNRDGKQDLVAVGQLQLTVLFGDGQGSVYATVDHNVPYSEPPYSIVMGDAVGI